MKKKRKLGSLITGIGLGIVLGIWANFIYQFTYSKIIYIILGISIFGFMSYIKPRTTEVLAYAISIYIFLQMGWDYAVGDRGNIRLTLLYLAITMLIINIFSGYYSIKKPLKIFGKAIGIK